MLKSTIECRLGLFDVMSMVALRILKSPIKIHGMSCMHEIIRISCRKSFLRSLLVGPYTLVNMNCIPRLLISTTVVE
jgi:hypothetical protein